jgi:hypothetical protein
MPQRPEKILLAMRRLSGGSPKPLSYEEIVVSAFQMFPEEFGLRGYPQYPDSSDIHKPLYGPLKRKGLVRNADKRFALTARGVEVTERLARAAGSIDEERLGERLSRPIEKEVERVLATNAVKLVAEDKQEKLLDIDFYSFLDCTVRTHYNEFLGRVSTVETAVKEAKRLSWPDQARAELLNDTWQFLRKKFERDIEIRKPSKKG